MKNTCHIQQLFVTCRSWIFSMLFYWLLVVADYFMKRCVVMHSVGGLQKKKEYERKKNVKK